MNNLLRLLVIVGLGAGAIAMVALGLERHNADLLAPLNLVLFVAAVAGLCAAGGAGDVPGLQIDGVDRGGESAAGVDDLRLVCGVGMGGGRQDP